MLDHPIGDYRCDQIEIGCIVADLSDYLPIVKTQLVRIDAGYPILA